MAKLKVKLEKMPHIQGMYIGGITSKKIKDEDVKNLFLQNFEENLNDVLSTQTEIDLMVEVVRISIENPKITLPVIAPNEAMFERLMDALERAKEETLDYLED